MPKNLSDQRFLFPVTLCLCVMMSMAPVLLAQHDSVPATGTSRTELMMSGDFRKVVQQAKDKVFPAVVFIKVQSRSNESGRQVIRESLGSGVIISPEGHVLTNWHVVDQAVEVRCLLSDGRPFNAQVLGTDQTVDLAVLKLDIAETDAALPYAQLGDSTQLQEGDFVMAMGAPFGLNRSVSIGIISCLRRYLPDRSEYNLWLQTDASISPGNSGGPLVDTQGKIIGLNTRGVTRGGDIGFAIPSEMIEVLLPYLRDEGEVAWSWTGIKLQPLKDFNRNIYFDGDEGVIISDTDPESPGRRAGLKPRDRLLAINDVPVTAMTEEDLPAVRRMIGLLAKDEPAELKLDRNGQTLTLLVTPREKGAVEGEELELPRWDMTVKAINQFDNPELYFHRKTGVFIYGLKRPGNAIRSGLRPNDIILKINGQEIEELEQLENIYDQAIGNLDQRHRISLQVLRNGLLNQVVLDYARDFRRQ